MPGNFASMTGLLPRGHATERMTGENLGTDLGFLLDTTETMEARSWQPLSGDKCVAPLA
jgi:hypothetical protein